MINEEIRVKPGYAIGVFITQDPLLEGFWEYAEERNWLHEQLTSSAWYPTAMLKEVLVDPEEIYDPNGIPVFRVNPAVGDTYRPSISSEYIRQVYGQNIEIVVNQLDPEQMIRFVSDPLPSDPVRYTGAIDPFWNYRLNSLATTSLTEDVYFGLFLVKLL